MYPHRSHRECDVSQRIAAPQLSQAISSIGRILPRGGFDGGTARWRSRFVPPCRPSAGAPWVHAVVGESSRSLLPA